MEKFKDIIREIKNSKPVEPPETLVDQIMTRISKIDQNRSDPVKPLLFREKIISPDMAMLFSGRIISNEQCAFLLFAVGFFYFVAGVVAVWGLHGLINRETVSVWLKIQPFMAIASALFIFVAAICMISRPQTISVIQYGMMAHTALIVINAFILESILSLPFAELCAFVLTILAAAFGVLLIGSIRSVLRFSRIQEGTNRV